MAARKAKLVACTILLVVCVFIYSKQLTYFVPTRDEPARIGNVLRPEIVVTSAPHVPPMEYEYVIAHYKENLDWLKPFANYCHVYDKGHDAGLKPSFRVKDWEELPNVGRESYPYLYHIIKNYENLANITVFLQGKIGDPAPTFCFQSPQDFVAKAREGVPCVLKGKVSWGKIYHIAKWKVAYDKGLMRHAKNGTLGEFYQTVFGKPPPPSADRCLASCFSGTRRCLQKRPKEFYQKAISFVDDHVDPEEGHYLERLWRTIVAC